MRLNKNQYNCCGCTACENICPKQAISMQPDSLGFLYPKIDNDKCIDCGSCVRICKFTDGLGNESKDLPIVFAVRSKNVKELCKSQSGAAFFELAKVFIQLGGVVYGASLESDFTVKHIKVTTLEGLDRLRMSKYTQSQLSGILQQVKADLQNGRNVLFSGTPCQISGLNAFIPEKNKMKLTTIDLVCHGVPSPFVWKKYIEYLEDKYGTVKGCIFRDKKFGWASHFETFSFSNGKTMSTRIFRDLFYDNLMLRYSCYECPFTNFNRVSDITIGDFWGWSKFSTQFNDNLGVSLVLINSEKGKYLFNAVKPYIQYIQSNANDCLQPQLQHPSQKNPHREQFEYDFEQKGFQYVARKYGAIGFNYIVKMLLICYQVFYNKVKWHLKRIIK